MRLEGNLKKTLWGLSALAFTSPFFFRGGGDWLYYLEESSKKVHNIKVSCFKGTYFWGNDVIIILLIKRKVIHFAPSQNRYVNLFLCYWSCSFWIGYIWYLFISDSLAKRENGSVAVDWPRLEGCRKSCLCHVSHSKPFTIIHTPHLNLCLSKPTALPPQSTFSQWHL